MEWSKDCYLCIDAKEDMSDIPNVSFADGKIVDIVKLDDNRAEITLDKPNSSGIKTGTNVRVHGKSGAYLYAYSKTLNPGEECLISSEIQKDETLLQYTSKAFSRGVFCVVPIILSYSTDPSKENTILVEEFTTSY